MMSLSILHLIDITGTFVFALSGTTAGIRKGFDFFGIFVLAFVTAVGGGVMRDVLIGVVPPPGLIKLEYLVAVVAALLIGVVFQKPIFRMEKPTLWLDALGLGFFAAFGAEKTYQYTGSVQLAIILGCLSAVGGGAVRDLLAGRSPVILSKEIYASAAIIGAAIALLGPMGIIPAEYSIWLAICTCTFLRVITMHFKINLPIFKDRTLPK